TNWGVSVPTDVRSDLGGIRFTLTPSAANGCAPLLPVGLVFAPNLGVSVKERATGADIVLTNTVRSIVTNQNAKEPVVTDDADDDLTIKPVDGEGPDLVDKRWLTD